MESHVDQVARLTPQKVGGLVYKLAMFLPSLVKKTPMIYTMVLLPWLMWSSYLVFYKTPTYQSTASFLIDQPQTTNKDNDNALKTLFSKKQRGRTGVDVNLTVLQDFIHSPAMLTHLQQQFNIVSYYQSSKIDRLSRLKKHLNQDDLFKYFQDKLVTSTGASNELNISVRAFSPEQAQMMMRDIVKTTSDFFNQATNVNYIEQSRRIDKRLEIAKEKYQQAKWAQFQFQHTVNPSEVTNNKLSLAKDMAVEFAKTEYQDAQEAYVLWHMKARKHALVLMMAPTLSPYVESPLLPQDIFRTLIVLLLFYGIGRLLMLVVSEHTE